MIIVSISISDLFPPSLLFISSFHLCVDFCNSLAETKLLLYYTSSWNEGFFSGLGSRKIFFLAPATRFFFSRLRLRLLVFFHSSPALAPNFFQGLGAGKFFFGSGSGYSFFSVGSGSSSSFFQLSLAPNSFISRLRLRL